MPRWCYIDIGCVHEICGLLGSTKARMYVAQRRGCLPGEYWRRLWCFACGGLCTRHARQAIQCTRVGKKNSFSTFDVKSTRHFKIKSCLSSFSLALFYNVKLNTFCEGLILSQNEYHNEKNCTQTLWSSSKAKGEKRLTRMMNGLFRTWIHHILDWRIQKKKTLEVLPTSIDELGKSGRCQKFAKNTSRTRSEFVLSLSRQ